MFTLIPYNVDVKIIKQLEVQLAQFDLSENALMEHKSVDILISVDFLSQTVTGERRIIDSLIVELTHFEWVAAGIVNAGPAAVNTCACSLIIEIQEDLKKFWEVEEVEAISSTPSNEELAKEYFKAHVTRLENDKFSVALPFCKDKSLIANTYGMAYAALLQNERQLDAPVRQAYREFMAKYLNLGYMELIPENEVKNPVT